MQAKFLLLQDHGYELETCKLCQHSFGLNLNARQNRGFLFPGVGRYGGIDIVYTAELE